jgi:hypothetical protein
MVSLVEVDSLEILVIIDNELDPISTYSIPGKSSVFHKQLEVSGPGKPPPHLLHLLSMSQ